MRSGSWSPSSRAARCACWTRGCPTLPRRPTAGCRRGPGTEPGLLLAIANYLIQHDLINKDFLRRWVNWKELLGDSSYLEDLRAGGRISDIPHGTEFEDFLALLKQLYCHYTLEWAEAESEVPASEIEAVAKEIAAAGDGVHCACLAECSGGPSRRMDVVPVPVLPQCADRIGRHAGRRHSQLVDQVRSPAAYSSRTREGPGTGRSGPRSTPLPTSRWVIYFRTCSGRRAIR